MLSNSVRRLYTEATIVTHDKSQDDEQFWSRFLQDGASLSIIQSPTVSPITPDRTDAPILPPTSAPVFPPTPAPVFPPTASPVVPPTTAAPVVPPTAAPVFPPTGAPVTPPTAAPVIPPTAAPIFQPTVAPIAPPTLAPVTPPTAAPVPLPTIAPVAPPTPAPVFMPNPAPVFIPLPVPVPVPVVVPTPTGPTPCFLQVDIDCETSEGLPCEEIPPLPTNCTDSVGLLSLTFQVLNFTCDQSSNSQGNKTFCGDFAPLTNISTVVCLSESQAPLIVTPANISFGGFFTVTNPNGGLLPNQTDCTIINANNVKVQQNVIDTTGNSPINAGDRWGALTLVTCGNTDCFETITYFIDIANLSPASINITNVDFTFQNETESLLADLQANPLGAGQSTKLDESRDINICLGTPFSAGVVVGGSSPSTGFCQVGESITFNCATCP